MRDGNLGRMVGVSAFYGWRLDDLKDDFKTGCMKIGCMKIGCIKTGCIKTATPRLQGLQGLGCAGAQVVQSLGQWLGWLLVWGVLWVGVTPGVEAGALADRITDFPHWIHPPVTRPVQGDLVYPQWFEGTWQATSTLVEQVAPLAPGVVTPGFDRNSSQLQKPVSFPVRFVRHIPPQDRVNTFLLLPPAQDSQVVADRAFNGLSIAQAYLGESGVVSVTVNDRNPNEQLTRLQGNVQLLTVVSDRATETPNSTQFITTEVCQQIFRGLSSPFFNIVETTTAYQYQPPLVQQPARMSADQITAIYLSPQDPDYFKAGDHPVALYRYQLYLQRL